ncbi:hypothetical protein ABZ897_31995 [Nonomuraea sp. NPDC046802]|uniref:hypothetical protein n=1 Tax=Nonomuraea sp. NPDC046802 TaxID=3154919 RepID=UPI0033DBEC73
MARMKRKRPISDRTRAVHRPPDVSHHAGSPAHHLSGNMRKRPASAHEEPGATSHTAPRGPRPFSVEPRELPRTQKVQLVPHVAVKGDTIESIAFGRTRTPSPYGNRMGDHTGSWTSVVDSVHALLYGKPIKETVRLLRDKQRKAEAWMSNEGSPGMKLWRTLEPADQDKRQGALEHYAHQVDDLLKQAENALSRPPTDEAGRQAVARAPELLSEAIGHHLAYRNFLPYATVPAKSQTGSKGAGEGSARADVLAVETHPEATLSQEAQKKTRESLWKLFSMEAAVREADIERVVAPTRSAEISQAIGEARKLSARVRGLIPAFLVPDAEPAKKRRKMTPAISAEFAEETDAIMRDAKELADRDTGYPEMREMTTQIIQTVRLLSTLTLEVQPKDSDLLKEYDDALNRRSGTLDALNKSLDDSEALENGALILAHLLYEHQTAVAEAYPTAVKKSGFLTADAAKAAADRIHDYLMADERMGAEPDATRKLADRIEELHATLGPRPTPAADSKWVSDSSTDSLVVAFRSDGELVVQGRAAAPYGVGGHGSHTTAWVTEVEAVKRMAVAFGKEGIAEKLGKEVDTAINAATTPNPDTVHNGELMTKLAALLPAEQLASGQLSAIFDAATNVMAAESPEESIKAYLTFRNLLPYATVDAGDRGGHGERRGANSSVLFDEKSLQAAIEQKKLEFDGPRFASTIDVMKGAVQELTSALDRSEDTETTAPGEEAVAPPPKWRDYPAVEEAAKMVAATMASMADKLDKDHASGTPVNTDALCDTIMPVRRREHERVYKLARPSPRPGE